MSVLISLPGMLIVMFGESGLESRHQRASFHMASFDAFTRPIPADPRW
jgi:hypothetical protein